MRTQKTSAGFTIIEMVVVVIIIGILSTLVITTYSGVQAQNRNKDRQADIDTLQSQLEVYYAQYSRYPTLANLNDGAWRQANLKNLSTDTLKDPRWSDKNNNCAPAKQVAIINTVKTGCYTYQPVGPDGAACNNDAVECTQYTLTAQLEGTGKYVKGSLN